MKATLRTLPCLLLLLLVGGLTAAPAEADPVAVLRTADGPVTAFDVATAPDGTPVLALVQDGREHAPAEVVLELGEEALGDGVPLGWSTHRAPEPAPGAVLAIDLAITGPGPVVVQGVDPHGRLAVPPGSEGWPLWSFAASGRYAVAATVAGMTTHYLLEVPAPVEAPVGPAPVEPEPDDPAPVAPAPAEQEPAEQEPAEQEPAEQEPAEQEPAAPPPAADLPPEPAPAPSLVAQEDVCAVPGLPADAVRVSDGHLDYGVQVVDGGLDSRVKDDRTGTPTWRDPATVLVEVGEPARKQVPANPALAFLGTAGSDIWTIGQVQEAGVPWLGWNTQHESATGNIQGATTWRLDTVEGPGQLFVYQTGAFGSITPVLGIADGWPRSTLIPANVHAHGNWSFTRPGVYRVTTTHLARLTSGGEVSSTDTVTFRVGPCAQAAPGPASDVGKAGDKAGDGKKGTKGTTSKSAPDGPGAGTPAAPSPAPVRATPECVPVTGGAEATAPSGGAGATAPAAPQATPTTRTTVSDGHFDFGSMIEGGAMRARVKDDRSQPPSWVEPESLSFVIGGPARQEVPAGAAYSFLGAPGDPIWLISQTQVSGVPWLGWNTQHETVRQQVRGPVRYRLDGVSGPGRMAVYLTDSFGGVGQRMFGDVSGFPRSFDVPLNVHAHGNWVFTAAGTYEVTITQSATLNDGTAVADSATLNFVVGGGSGGGSGGGGRSVGLTAPLTLPATLPRAAIRDCIPATGADDSLTVLLPLGVTLVVSGAAVLGVRRRSIRRLAHA